MMKFKVITALTVTAIFGLAACGGGSSDKNDSTVTTVRQKNAALSYTTLPGRTVTTPVPSITVNNVPSPTSTAPNSTSPAKIPVGTTVAPRPPRGK